MTFGARTFGTVLYGALIRKMSGVSSVSFSQQESSITTDRDVEGLTLIEVRGGVTRGGSSEVQERRALSGSSHVSTSSTVKTADSGITSKKRNSSVSVAVKDKANNSTTMIETTFGVKGQSSVASDKDERSGESSLEVADGDTG